MLLFTFSLYSPSQPFSIAVISGSHPAAGVRWADDGEVWLCVVVSVVCSSTTCCTVNRSSPSLSSVNLHCRARMTFTRPREARCMTFKPPHGSPILPEGRLASCGRCRVSVGHRCRHDHTAQGERGDILFLSVTRMRTRSQQTV